MELYDWDFFSTWDDSTLIPVNFTAQEMALLRSVISVMDNVETWSDEADFYSDVQPTLETILYIIRDE